jgi:hypothetical protein
MVASPSRSPSPERRQSPELPASTRRYDDDDDADDDADDDNNDADDNDDGDDNNNDDDNDRIGRRRRGSTLTCLEVSDQIIEWGDPLADQKLEEDAAVHIQSRVRARQARMSRHRQSAKTTPVSPTTNKAAVGGHEGVTTAAAAVPGKLELSLRVYKGENLKSVRGQGLRLVHFEKQDPYLKYTINGVEGQTGVQVEGGTKPDWKGEECRIQIPAFSQWKHEELEVGVECWDHAADGNDRFIGRSMAVLTPPHEKSHGLNTLKWYALTDNTNGTAKRGRLELSITVAPAAKISRRNSRSVLRADAPCPPAPTIAMDDTPWELGRTAMDCTLDALASGVDAAITAATAAAAATTTTTKEVLRPEDVSVISMHEDDCPLSDDEENMEALGCAIDGASAAPLPTATETATGTTSAPALIGAETTLKSTAAIEVEEASASLEINIENFLKNTVDEYCGGEKKTAKAGADLPPVLERPDPLCTQLMAAQYGSFLSPPFPLPPYSFLDIPPSLIFFFP